MRKVLLGMTVALAVAGGMAKAGGMGEPVMEPAVVEARTASSAGIVVPLLLLILVAVAVSGGGDGDRGRDIAGPVVPN